MRPAAADGGCSSFPLNGRFVSARSSVPSTPRRLTFDADAQRPITTAAADLPGRFQGLQRPPTGSTSRRSTIIQIPLERYGVFANVKQELGGDINFCGQGASGTAASRRTRRRRCRSASAPTPATATCSTRSRSTRPTRSIRSASTSSRRCRATIIADPAPRHRRRAAPLQPEGRTPIYGVATLDGVRLGGRDWYWDVNGIYGRNKAKQTMLGNINAANLQQALGPVAACTGAVRAVQHLRRRRARSRQAMLDFIGFIQHDSSEQKIWDVTANISGKLFELPGGAARPRGGRRVSRPEGPLRPRSGRRRRLQLGHSGAADQGRLQRQGSLCRAQRAAPQGRAVRRAARAERRGAAISDYSTVRASNTTFKAGVNWKPIERPAAPRLLGPGLPRAVDRRVVRHAVALRLARSTIPARSHSTQARNFHNDATVRANCIAHGVPAGGATAGRPQMSVITGGNEDLKPETSKSWVFGGVCQPEFLRGFSIELN